MEKRELTCICCPLGCQITVTLEDGKVVDITGNTCKRGYDYAGKEVTNPTRIVTSTVVVNNGKKERVSCKTQNDIPKDKIFEVMKEINGIRKEAPVHIGDILLENVAGTEVNIVSTGNVEVK